MEVLASIKSDQLLKKYMHLLIVRGLFLDISEAFDKVWYEGIIFKLNQIWKIVAFHKKPPK